MSPSFRFSNRTYRILEQFAKIALTSNALKQYSLEKCQFRRSVERLLSSGPFLIRVVPLLTLWLFEIEALLRTGRFFTRLHPSAKDRYFKRWAHSRWYLRYLFMRNLLIFVNSAYYSHHEISQSLGFTDFPSGRKVVSENGLSILEEPNHDTEIDVEICVIGSGAGGAVVARELALQGHEVLILEEGGSLGQKNFQTLSTMDRNRLIYRDAGFTPTLGFPPVLLPTGKCVGGTTVINSGTCFRTPSSILKKWNKEFGLSELDEQSLNPYFERVEKILQIQPVPTEILGGNNEIIRQGVQRLGLHGEPLVRNAPGCQGSGVCIFGCPTGSKQSMERSYLPLAIQAGARLYAHCHVDRLERQYDRVHKIRACFTDPHTGQKRSQLTIYPKKVVVSCGTLESPLLLKRSRLGLQSGQLGKNMTIHPAVKMMGIFDDNIDGFRGVPQGYAVTDFEDQGMMFESVFFPPWLLAMSMHQSQEAHRYVMEAYRRLGIFGFLVHDQGRGRVFAGPGGRPIVWYSLGKKEVHLFIEGLKVLGRIFFAAGAKKIYPTIRTIDVMTSLDEVEKLSSDSVKRRDLEMTAFHPLGTCRMGADPGSSVVDGSLRLHGMENCWVADGSVFPSSLGVNPQITIMAFATRCAEMIHQA